jgi:hypothetical protein
MKKSDVNPMHPEARLLAAPRCQAHSKRTGMPCKAPAVRGWAVCRMHGARGGHGPGKASPAYRNGSRTREAVHIRRWAMKLVRDAHEIDAVLKDAPCATERFLKYKRKS